jgi:phosphoglycerol transferase
MALATFLSLLLVISGLAVCVRSGRSKALNGLLSFEALVCLFLLIGYALADHFTGEGINSAVWYHVRYGLRGAGFQDYRGVMVTTVLALLFALVAVVALIRWRRHQPRRVSVLVVGQLLLISAWITNPAIKDLIALSRTHSPATADFYRHAQPASLTSISPEHRSFVFIFAESLERTFFDEQRFPGLITHLSALEGQGVSFTNIHTVEATGFTMGGMVASLCGVPLFTPAHANSMSGMDAFLPGAVGLTDLLHDQGYFLSFIGGASLDFAGKRKFLSTHHFDESAGFQELHGRTQDRKYINNWGLYDDTMFDFAAERVSELSSQKRPFGLFVLTLDTHPPDGHVSKSAKSGPYGDGSNPMLNAVKASDELIARFVHRVWASPGGKDLVVVIVSDHLAMENSAIGLLKRGERRNLFLILDPRNLTGTRVDRLGSTLDTGVTMLPALGFKGRLNLGRDLRDPATSESEIVHIQKTETLLSWRPEIIRLWDFPRFTKSFAFDPKSAHVTIDGRQFQAPVLVELARDGRTTLRFQFDALYEAHLAQQAVKLAPGTRYLLVAKTDDAQILLQKPPATDDSSWVLIAGRAGEGHTTVPLSKEATFSRSQVDDLLTHLTAPPVRSASLPGM